MGVFGWRLHGAHSSRVIVKLKVVEMVLHFLPVCFIKLTLAYVTR